MTAQKWGVKGEICVTKESITLHEVGNGNLSRQFMFIGFLQVSADSESYDSYPQGSRRRMPKSSGLSRAKMIPLATKTQPTLNPFLCRFSFNSPILRTVELTTTTSIVELYLLG